MERCYFILRLRLLRLRKVIHYLLEGLCAALYGSFEVLHFFVFLLKFRQFRCFRFVECRRIVVWRLRVERIGKVSCSLLLLLNGSGEILHALSRLPQQFIEFLYGALLPGLLLLLEALLERSKVALLFLLQPVYLPLVHVLQILQLLRMLLLESR